MKYIIDKLTQGHNIDRNEAILLYGLPLKELMNLGNSLREQFCSNSFDLCSIINAKSGACPEDCKYCAQSHMYPTDIRHYDLLPTQIITQQAKYNAEKGVMRFSIVTSGKRPTPSEFERICEAVKTIRNESKIGICASLGLLSSNEYLQLKKAGVSRIHNNLETSRRYFPYVCTTHSYEDKINAIKAAQDAGLEVCSGGIIGLGETYEDRIDMALTLRELGIKSVPINVLNPIHGTPYENNPPLCEEEIIRCISIFRCIMPHAAIRLAGGRGRMSDKGLQYFLSGANAAITGDMLTTSGIEIQSDIELIRTVGYSIRSINE